MVYRYLELLDVIKDFDELQDLLPSPATNRRLRKLLDDLEKVESVSYELQSESCTLLEARVYFDALVDFRAEFAYYLGPRAAITHLPSFEDACVKVLDGRMDALTRSEKATLARFAMNSTAQAVDAPSSVDTRSQKSPSFAEQVKKKHKTAGFATSYELLGSIPPTSNVVERLFSVAKATLGT